ncbi:hypothetical protein K469DRAFT_657411 [Zopfia rhizophila CBS 207.26]|uniref:Tetraspanin Tsp3 n=1 Tax=Zopfia rhizophila CBS 207.26 TaxID=1314779 RepID=A0A6A6EIS1_9PEZI|nr:hypothetical protein K469DRAFT_657411 [Zopfia rhizophila CBS 207.26]
MAMAYTRKQIVTCASIVYLIIATALAAYASSRSNRRSVPIPSSLSGFTTALPVIAGLLLEGGYDFTRHQERHTRTPRGQTPRPPLVIVVNTLIFIYSSVVITLLGTHAAPPSDLDCNLDRRWSTLFRHKNSEAIRTIQDAFNCCGLRSARDRAWPFQDRDHGVDACEKAFGRTSGCFGPWRGEEQRVAGLLMGVVGLVFVWQFVIIVTPTRRTSWFHRVLPERLSRALGDEEQGSSSGPRRQIDYLPDFSRYSDNVTAESSDSEDESTTRRAIEGGVQQVKNAVTTSGSNQEQQPTVENEWARQ